MMHTDRSAIVRNYLGGNFKWDLIVVIPFIASQFNIPYADFTLLLRVTRVQSMVFNLEEILNLKESFQAVFDLF